MNEEQKFKVGDLVKLEGWDDYRTITSIDDEYVCFVNAEGMQWYNTFKHEFIKYVEKEDEMQNTESNKDMQEKKTEDTFKVGDVVYCLIWGKGYVTNIHSRGEYPIFVKFVNSEDVVTYKHDGKLYADGQRTLFFSEPKIEALTTRPFTPTLIGKKVSIVSVVGLVDLKYVKNEDSAYIFCEDGSEICKNYIKELYILGENVVNSIK